MTTNARRRSGSGAAGSSPVRPRRWPGCRSASSSTGGSPLRPARVARHARVLHQAGLLDDAELTRMLAALDDLARPAAPAGSARPPPTRTCTRRWSGACWSGSGRWGQAPGRPQPQRPDRHRPAALPARPRPPDHQQADRARDRADGPGQRHLGTPAPGMTHLQHAQPVLLAHQLLAHVQAFARDAGPLAGLGPAGGGVPARRGRAGRVVAAARPGGGRRRSDSASTRRPGNSMDAVSDRDFAAEFCFAAALLGVHLSRLGEEVVLWSSHEFGWAEIDDAYATGSSIMPQKKNPDVAELARGEAGPADRRADRAADHAQGPAAGLRPRPAGETRSRSSTRSTRCCWCCPPWPGWSARCGSTGADRRGRGGGLRARHRPGRAAGPARGPVPRGARGRRPSRGLVPGARLRAGRGERRRPGAGLAAPDP